MKAQLLALNLLFFTSSLAIANNEYLRLQFFSQLQSNSPCLASLVGPPTTSCIPWQPNVEAYATFEASRRLIFAGSDDHLLHILDADNGRKVMEVKTQGRVITAAVFSDDHSIFYLGTDKGVIHSFDAYTFACRFTFLADGKIDNNLTVIDSSLVFTSALGTVYSLNGHSGILNWRLLLPLAKPRLRLLSNSNIFVVHDDKDQKQTTLIVPHADGLLRQIFAQTGEIKNQIALGSARENGFPDVVAPLIFLKNRLWVASYDLGIFSVDNASMKIRYRVPDIKEIVQLATDDTTLYAASSDVLYAISDRGNILYKTPLSEIKTRASRAGWPFDQFSKGRSRIFFGSPSRLLLTEDRIIMSTSLGSIGVFDKATGHPTQFVGNSVGFGPLEWASSSSIMAVTKRGLLMKFQIRRSL